MKYFSSDWHLGHKRIIELSNRPFHNVEEMDEVIIENMLAPLKAGDEFYFLGDMTFQGRTATDFLERIPKNVKFFWIIGNHDPKMKFFPNHIQVKMIGLMETKIQGNSVTLCHYPMFTYNKSHHNAWHLFGHHHKGSYGHEEIARFETSGKRLNVNCEFNNYKPWSEDEIVAIMEERPDNWDKI